MTDDNEQSEPRDAVGSHQSAVVSYAFWTTLFVAAVIYATVAISPKLERLMVLKREHHQNMWHLVELERRVRHLDRVANALETDPAFAAELARSRFGAVDPGSETISVSDELHINTIAPTQARRVDLPWHYGIVSRFARSKPLRTGSLTLAACLTLFGFGFLHTRYTDLITAGTSRVGAVVGSFVSRYTSTEESD